MDAWQGFNLQRLHGGELGLGKAAHLLDSKFAVPAGLGSISLSAVSISWAVTSNCAGTTLSNCCEKAFSASSPSDLTRSIMALTVSVNDRSAWHPAPEDV
jgi:hypothetical protein